MMARLEFTLRHLIVSLAEGTDTVLKRVYYQHTIHTLHTLDRYKYGYSERFVSRRNGYGISYAVCWFGLVITLSLTVFVFRKKYRLSYHM